MGDVLSFSLRSRPAGDSAPSLPAWAQALVDVWADPNRWRVSRKGNPYCRISVGGAELCVTLFPRGGFGWRWCIASDAAHRPLWSEREFETIDEARSDA
jgi:hypothetical protein